MTVQSHRATAPAQQGPQQRNNHHFSLISLAVIKSGYLRMPNITFYMLYVYNQLIPSYKDLFLWAEKVK